MKNHLVILGIGMSSGGKLLKTAALVLRTRPLGESDRLINLLTRETGIITAVVKGARKTKSKLSAGVDLFIYGDYILFQGKTLYTLTQYDIIETFPGIKEDPAAYSYASYFAELAQRTLAEEEKNDGVFDLLLEGWRSLKEGRDYFLLARAFELKILSKVGYHPYFEECIYCKKSEIDYFSVRHGGLICKNCCNYDGQAIPFSEGSLSLVKFFLNTSLLQSAVIRANPLQKKELYRYTLGLLQYYLEIGECKSLQYINKNLNN